MHGSRPSFFPSTLSAHGLLESWVSVLSSSFAETEETQHGTPDGPYSISDVVFEFSYLDDLSSLPRPICPMAR